MSLAFKNSAEYIAALRRLTSSKSLFRKLEKSVLNEIVGTSIPFIPSFTSSELRSFSKSLFLIQSVHKLNVNSLVFKVVNKKLIELGSAENPDFHSIISILNSLSQIVREKHDGGPPPLRPDTVWQFANEKLIHASVFDKCEFLTVLSRLNLKPFNHMMFRDKNFGNDRAIFFAQNEIEILREYSDRGKANGRIVASIIALLKLDCFAFRQYSSFSELLRLIPSRIDELSPMELSNLAYSFTASVVLESEDEAGLLPQEESDSRIRTVIQILRNLYRKRSSISVAAMNQIGVVHFTLNHGASDIYTDEIQRIHNLRKFLDDCLDQCGKDTVNELKQSKAQQVVRKSIDRIGLFDIMKDEVPVGPFRLDFAIPELCIGIEIDGPYHFYYKSSEVTAKTRFKRIALENQLGYRIITVPFTELKEEGDKVKFFDEKIRSILGISKKVTSLRSEVKRMIGESQKTLGNNKIRK